MPAKIDMTGRQYGRLTVVRLAPKHARDRHWICQCACGQEVIIQR